MKTNPNESAWPTGAANHSIHVDKAFGIGLTKREYFAAMAMQGWIACQHEGFTGEPPDIAKRSLECADALIEELNKE